MRRIAFLSFDWDYEIVSGYYEAMQSLVAEKDDVQLVIFNAFGEYTNYEPEDGAYEIFSLCDIRAYDGFIIQGNRTWPPAMRQHLVDEMCAAGKPVVSLNYKLTGAYAVGTNNHDAMFGLVKRVLSDRGCTSAAFVSGLATSWEAQARTRAFKHACRECGVSDMRIIDASWEMEEGVKAALRLLEDQENLPEVVFCANDDLAVGVQETLQAHGVRVPQDVMVTGFDNRDISLNASPRITTVDRDYRGIACTAIEVLLRLIDGEDQLPQVSSPARYILAESCGYANQSETKEDLVRDLYTMDSALKGFYHVLSRFQPAVLNAEVLPDILSECERFFPEVRCPRIFLSLNDSYLVSDVTRNVTSYGTVSKLMAQLGWEQGMASYERHVYTSFLTEGLVPYEVPMGAGTYMVFPLRHHTTCIGTLVTEGVSPSLRYGFLTIVLTLIASTIETVRKKEQLQAAIARLDDLYVRDQLTGLFNRFGLERIGAIAYEHLLRDFDEAQFIFVDIDWMKQINDAYGHEVGDLALRDAADIINRAMVDENAFAMRYGGDEFLLISRRDLTDKIKHELEVLKATCKRPYDLSLSVGAQRVLRSEHLSVREAIDRADAKMYRIKKARGTERA